MHHTNAGSWFTSSATLYHQTHLKPARLPSYFLWKDALPQVQLSKHKYTFVMVAQSFTRITADCKYININASSRAAISVNSASGDHVGQGVIQIILRDRISISQCTAAYRIHDNCASNTITQGGRITTVTWHRRLIYGAQLCRRERRA